MAGGIDVPERVVIRIEVAMEAGWAVELAEIAVLGEESAEVGIEVTGFCVLARPCGVPRPPTTRREEGKLSGRPSSLSSFQGAPA
jgi:hypothetical protein